MDGVAGNYFKDLEEATEILLKFNGIDFSCFDWTNYLEKRSIRK